VPAAEQREAQQQSQQPQAPGAPEQPLALPEEITDILNKAAPPPTQVDKAAGVLDYLLGS
jgi:hypothetical protein